MKYKEMVKEGQIQEFKKEDISPEPMALPPGFEWDTFDITNDEEVDEICEYLMNNYVEDQVGNFRLHYTKEKFRWACASPGYIKEWHFLIRSTKNRKILATCVGCPRKIVIHGEHVKICEGNFLSVHYSLRKKRMAQVVILEMMRRKRIHGYPQGLYTSSHVMPTPFVTNHYMNRFINSKKLTEIQYTHKPPN